MHLHEAEALSIHWTRDIEVEWTRNVAAKHDAAVHMIQACLNGMRDAVEGWEVTGHARHAARFESVDAKDRHVAAAAYQLSLDDALAPSIALVTQNTKDFPPDAFKGTRVRPYAMSGYLEALHAEAPELVASVAEGCRKKLKAPPLTREEYVAVLMKNHCTGLARALSVGWAVECPVLAKDGTLYYASDAQALKPQRPRKPRP